MPLVKLFSFGLLLGLFGLAATTPIAWAEEHPEEQPEEGAREETPLGDEDFAVPFRIRDLTFPSFLTLGFLPEPAAPLGRRGRAWEVHASFANSFQVSQAVEDLLGSRRSMGGSMADRRPLDASEVEAILALPAADSFYIDGEFGWLSLAYHHGLTRRLDLSIYINALTYSGGLFDSTIFDFHDAFGFGQQGRTLAAEDQFQIVLGDGAGGGFVLLDRPDPGGLTDPYFGLRYAFPGTPGGWRFSAQVAVKPPIADEEKFRSTGSVDFGGQLTIDRHWSHHALILNVAAVDAGRFRFTEDFEPPLLTSATLSYLYRFQKTAVSIQGLVAENAFSDLGGSALGDLALQVTLGVKRTTKTGVWGIAFTENISNFDNTPDIGVHLTWGLVQKGK